MKTILCYGDSLLWGFIPGSYDRATCLGKRYPKDKRLAGVLQNLLGETFNLVEENINGRTTDLDEKIPGRPYRNGLTYLPVSLESHYPIDLVIFMLGTNDMKIQYKRSVEESAEGVAQLIKTVKLCNKGPDGNTPKILLIAPPPLVEAINMQDQYDEESIEKSKKLGMAYQKIASKEGCDFLDASLFVKASKIDGVHFNEQQYELLSHAIHEIIIQLLQIDIINSTHSSSQRDKIFAHKL